MNDHRYRYRQPGALTRRITAGVIVTVCVLLLAFTGDRSDPTDNARQPCCGDTTTQN